MYKKLTASQRDVFWVCLLMANHKTTEWVWRDVAFKCKPGQFVTSLAKIKKLAAPDTSIRNIRTAFEVLEREAFLTSQATKDGRVITITNWDTYQQSTNLTDKGIDKGRRVTKELTKQLQKNDKATDKGCIPEKATHINNIPDPENPDRQSNRQGKPEKLTKELTTNKKDIRIKEKIYKKEKPSNGKIPVAEYVLMLPKEIETLNAKYGRERSAKMIEVLDNYVGANPKKRKYESHYRAILSWVVPKVLEEMPLGRETDGWNI